MAASESLEARLAEVGYLAGEAGANLSRGHVYFDVDEAGFEQLSEALIGGGWVLVRKPARRYLYAEAAWVIDAEFAKGKVGVYLRRDA